MPHCHRCDRSFRNLDALKEHIVNSSHHNSCSLCEVDCASKDELKVHQKAIHFCCHVCGEPNKTELNLKQHMVKHQKKEVLCFACDQLFISKSAMLLHLEFGHCQKAKLHWTNINRWAKECELSCDYIWGFDPNSDVLVFKCPDNVCEKEFPYVSALLQHVEMQRCSASENPDSAVGELLQHIRTSIRSRAY